MTDLDKPLIFIFDFAKKRGVTDDDLTAFAEKCGGTWVRYGCSFLHENQHADQVRHSLNKAFNDIMQYAETGIDPDKEPDWIDKD